MTCTFPNNTGTYYHASTNAPVRHVIATIRHPEDHQQHPRSGTAPPEPELTPPDMLTTCGDTAEHPIPAALETSRGLLVAAPRTTGRSVFAITRRPRPGIGSAAR